MTRFIAGFLTGAAALYVWALLQLATPETETRGDVNYPWPTGI